MGKIDEKNLRPKMPCYTVKNSTSECTKFRCWQRWRRTKRRGSRNFPTPTSFGSRHRCPHQNFGRLFYSVLSLKLVQQKWKTSVPSKCIVETVDVLYYFNFTKKVKSTLNWSSFAQQSVSFKVTESLNFKAGCEIQGKLLQKVWSSFSQCTCNNIFEKVCRNGFLC